MSSYICNHLQGKKRTLCIATCILLVKYMSHSESLWELHLEELWEMRESLSMKILLKLLFAITPLTKLTNPVPSSQIRYNCKVATTCCAVLKPIFQWIQVLVFKLLQIKALDLNLLTFACWFSQFFVFHMPFTLFHPMPDLHTVFSLPFNLN